jgi:glycerophosphoryl diester phosphodiesterase
MAVPRERRRLLAGRGDCGPAVIAHGGGNTLERAEAAMVDGADYLEVDLWVSGGGFEARHERRLSARLPLLFEKWYLSMAPRQPFGLAELISATKPPTGIFLDLKNGGEEAARLVRKSLDAAGPSLRMVASSQTWWTLRALARIAPEVDLFYSIDVPAKLDLFLSVARRDFRPRGVSCRESLLTPGVIAELHARDLLVVAWTVDNLDRAAELTGQGVEGITTNRVEAVREHLAGKRHA